MPEYPKAPVLERNNRERLPGNVEQPENVYEKAGLATGDLVAYRVRGGELDGKEILVVLGLDERGAWLHDALDGQKLNKALSMTAERVRKLENPGTKEMALNLFKSRVETIVKNPESPLIAHTLGQIAHLFTLAENAGAVTSDFGLNCQTWEQARARLTRLGEAMRTQDYEYAKRICMTFDIARGLRQSVITAVEREFGWSLYENAPAVKPLPAVEYGQILVVTLANGSVEKFGRMPNMERWLGINSRNNGFSGKNLTDAQLREMLRMPGTRIRVEGETAAAIAERHGTLESSLRRLPVDGVVRIGETRYRKMPNAEFVEIQDQRKGFATTLLISYSADEMLRRMRNAAKEAVDLDGVPIIRKLGEVRDVQEDAERVARFPSLARKLFPDAFQGGVMSWFKKPRLAQVIEHVQTSVIEQGKVGDCYLLSGLNSLKRGHPRLFVEYTARNISRAADDGGWEVRFPGLNEEYKRIMEKTPWINVSDSELQVWQKKTKLKGNTADILLELAYALGIDAVKNGGMDAARRKEIIEGTRKMSFEGGFGHRALFHVLSSELADKVTIGNYQTQGDKPFASHAGSNAELVRSFFEKIYTDDPSHYIVTANTPHSADGQAQTDQRSRMVDGFKLHYKHALSIVGFEKGRVQFQNPHNTGITREVSLETFLGSFSQLSYCTLKKKYKEMSEDTVIP